MNKQEILFKLSDTADRLESAGLLREAIVLTNVMKRMAQIINDGHYEYEYAINEIKDLFAAGWQSGTFNRYEEINEVYKKYINTLKEQIAQTSDTNLKKELEKRKQAFTFQTNRITDINNNLLRNKKPDGSTTSTIIGTNSLAEKINRFGLETATDLKDYNRRWQLFIDYLKKNKYSGIPNGKPIY